MRARKFSFDDEDPAAKNKAMVEAVEAKKQKFEQQAAKLVADEKRWLRKKRLANTKLKKITKSKRALRKRREAFVKTLKGNTNEGSDT